MGVAKSLSIENAAAARRYLASVEAERARYRRQQRDGERRRQRLQRVQRSRSRPEVRAPFVIALIVAIGAWIVL